LCLSGMNQGLFGLTYPKPNHGCHPQ